MGTNNTTRPSCDKLIALLEAIRVEHDALKQRIIELERQLADTRVELADTKSKLAAANKNSSNFSKPPSSDITKPPADPKHLSPSRTKRRLGGQPGHARHESALTLDDADYNGLEKRDGEYARFADETDGTQGGESNAEELP